MEALFEQFPMLLPALGIAAVAAMFLLAWVLTGDFFERPYRHDRRTGSGSDIWPGAPYDGTPHDGGSGVGGDCGSDGGACGGD